MHRIALIILALLFSVKSPAVPLRSLTYGELKEVMEAISLHARQIVSKEQWDRIEGQLESADALHDLREKFLTSFPIERKPDTLQYTATRTRYNPQGQIVEHDSSIWVNWPQQPLADSKTFIYAKDPLWSQLNLMVPLRVEEDFVIFLASSGRDRIPHQGIETSGAMPREYVVGIATRINNYKNLAKMKTAEAIFSTMFMQSFTAAEINDIYLNQEEGYPQFPEFNFRQVGIRDLTNLRLTMANRNLRVEVGLLVHMAATKADYAPYARYALNKGGVGMMVNEEGEEFFIQTLRLSNVVLPEEVKFVHALIDPNIRPVQFIRMAKSPESALAVLEDLKEKRAEKDMQKLLGKMNDINWSPGQGQEEAPLSAHETPSELFAYALKQMDVVVGGSSAQDVRLVPQPKFNIICEIILNPELWERPKDKPSATDIYMKQVIQQGL